MLTFHSGAAGAPSSAAAYANYLLEKTLPDEQRRLAKYYGASPGGADGPTVRADLRPEVAEALGVAPGATLETGELAHILAGKRADGGDLPSRPDGPDRQIAYYDLTFSVPKSVSLAWAMAGTEAERIAIYDACRAANDAMLRYVEREIAKTRDGAQRGHIAWATVPHFMARPTIEVTRPDPATGTVATEIHTVPTGGAVAGDPNVHFHNPVPNAMVMEDGRVLALDTYLMQGRIKEFGAVGQAVLATELRKLGIRVELDERTGLATLPAIPQHAVEHFSKRTNHGLDAARDLARAAGLDWDALDGDRRIALVKAATQKHKLAKDAAPSPEAAKAFEGMERRDGLADFAAWKAQAEAIGWRYSGTAESYGPPAPERDRAARLEDATTTALPILAGDLAKEAVQDATVGRVAIACGLIVAGTGEDVGEDMDAVVREMAHGRGVMQDGKWTRLLWRRGEGGRVRITTALHRDQERALINHARHAAADRAGALSEAELNAAIGRAGLTLSDEQENAARKLGCDGRFAVVIGSAGSGKTTTLRPLVDAWTKAGRPVWGVANAWNHADNLRETGVDGFRVRALQRFLDGVAQGQTTVGPRDVVVLDELGRVGTRQMLDLLRAQERHGFKVVAIGDHKQTRSVEAGPVIELLREALGEDAIPQILTTVRQRTEREREIVALFREGRIEEALSEKRRDGTAELVPGGREEAVARTVALWAERREANRGAPDYTITVSAPTNADAREISLGIRRHRLDAGEIDGDPRRAVQVLATDQKGDAYAMTLAAGDRVRLFRRTWGSAPDGKGRPRARHVGNNGTVLDVVEVRKDPFRGGLALRKPGDDGPGAFVPWATLRDRATGRIVLGHGDCVTIDAIQSATSDEHINAMPAGSRAVTGNKAYVAESRGRGGEGRVATFLVGSMGAEMREVRERRPRGVETQVTADEAWANLARNLGRETVKESALAFLREAHGLMRTAAEARLRTLRVRERRAAGGYPPTTLARNVERMRAERAVARVAERVERVVAEMASPMDEGRLRTILARGEQRHHMSEAAIMQPDPYGGLVEAFRALPEATRAGWQAHGTSLAGALALLRGGTDRGRDFHSGPLEPGVLGVDTTRLDNPVIFLSERGRSVKETGIRYAVLNGPAEALRDDLAGAFPEVRFFTATEAVVAIRQGGLGPPAAGRGGIAEPMSSIAAAPSASHPIRLPIHRVRVSEAEAQAQFGDAMRAAGFKPAGAPIMDGRAHSVAAPGDKGREKSGGYVGHYDDRPAGAFWTFKGGGRRWTWKAEGETVAMSSAEAEARAAKAAAEAAERERARGARQEAVARQAAWLLEGTRPADPSHPYLARKGVEPHGIRQDHAGRLVVPLRDADGKLWNLQTIEPDGTKLFLAGGRKAGTHHVLGEPKPGEPLVIAEGFATAATVRRATGLPVVVALDAGNLGPVAEAIRARDPDRPLVFAADNDAHLTRRDPPLPNAGIEKATHAARAVGNARVVAPQFAGHEQGTDWNDHAASRGLAATREALRDGMREREAPTAAMSPPAAAPQVRRGPRLGA